jgi:hypothetical protein
VRAAPALVVGSVLALVPLAGCGGDDGGGSLSATAYRDQANQICTTLKRDNEAALKDIDVDDRPALTKATKKVGERTQDALDRLDDLSGPDAAEAATGRFVDLARDFGKQAAKAKDPSTLQRLTQRVQAAARDAGLDACAG